MATKRKPKRRTQVKRAAVRARAPQPVATRPMPRVAATTPTVQLSQASPPGENPAQSVQPSASIPSEAPRPPEASSSEPSAGAMPWQRVKDFLFAKYEVKVSLAACLTIFAVIGLFQQGWSNLPHVLLAIGSAMLTDALIRKFYYKEIDLTAAWVTGTFVAIVLAPAQLSQWYIPVITSAVAIASKYVFRYNKHPLFNPTNFALLTVPLFLSTTDAWWGALTSAFLPLLLLFTIYISYRQRRFHLLASWLGTFFVLLFITHVAQGNPGLILNDLRESQIALFFAGFMVVEPITSPSTKSGRVVFGMVCALFATALQLGWVGALFGRNAAVQYLVVHSFPAALILSNALTPAINAIVKKVKAASDAASQERLVVHPTH